jgi:hypothetical protein
MYIKISIHQIIKAIYLAYKMKDLKTYCIINTPFQMIKFIASQLIGRLKTPGKFKGILA